MIDRDSHCDRGPEPEAEASCSAAAGSSHVISVVSAEIRIKLWLLTPAVWVVVLAAYHHGERPGPWARLGSSWILASQTKLQVRITQLVHNSKSGVWSPVERGLACRRLDSEKTSTRDSVENPSILHSHAERNQACLFVPLAAQTWIWLLRC